jgi:hypothetical protein
MKLDKLIESSLDTILFDPDEEGPLLQAKYIPGKSSLAVILGNNASGKSLLRRIISVKCGKANPKIESMAISMQLRTSGLIQNAFIFGDESYESTGRISSSTVSVGIRSSKGRENPHIIFWDEPDVGLSDEAAAGIGLEIAKYAQEPAPTLQGMFVVTHRRVLVQYLLQVDPHIIFMGANPPNSVQEWLDRPIIPSSSEALQEASHRALPSISKRLKE